MDGGNFQDEIYSEIAAFDNEGSSSAADHGWKKVSYAKTNRRKNNNVVSKATDLSANGSHVFATVELKAQERRRAMESMEDARIAAEDFAIRSRIAVADGADSNEEYEIGKENGDAEEVKKVKKVKQKKPKITVSEAASKIDSADLAAFLVEVTVSHC